MCTWILMWPWSRALGARPGSTTSYFTTWQVAQLLVPGSSCVRGMSCLCPGLWGRWLRSDRSSPGTAVDSQQLSTQSLPGMLCEKWIKFFLKKPHLLFPLSSFLSLPGLLWDSHWHSHLLCIAQPFEVTLTSSKFCVSSRLSLWYPGVSQWKAIW